MTQILPRDLPAAGSVNTSSAIIIDDGSGVKKATPAQLVSAGFPVASQAEAEAGIVSDKAMTPQRVSQAIDALGVSQAVLASTAGAAQVGMASGGTIEDAIKWVTPEQFGAVGDGVTDDTTALNDWADAIGDGVNGRASGNYLISARIEFVSKEDFTLEGGGRFKIANGTGTSETYSAFLFDTCARFLVQDFDIDGNRSGRTPSEDSGHLIRIIGGEDIVFRNVTARNGTTDGWYVRGKTPATASTYPTNVTLDNCRGLNCYRNGASIVGSKNLTVLGGRYADNNGTAPQAGFAIEPNSTDVYGNVNLQILDPVLEDNTGFGGYIGSGATSAPNGGVIRVSGRGNGEGLFEMSRCYGVKFSALVGDHPGTGVTKALVYVTAFASNVSLDVELAEAITTTYSANYVVLVDTSATNINVDRIKATFAHTLPTLRFGGANGGVRNVTSYDCTSSLAAIYAGSAAVRVKFENIDVRRPTAYGFYSEAANTKLEGFYIEDYAGAVSSVRCTAAGAEITNGEIKHTSGSFPGNPVRAIRFDAAPAVLANVTALEYSTSQFLTGSGADLTSTRAWGLVPNVLRGTTTTGVGPVSAGANATFTISVAQAKVGDTVIVTPPVDLQGMSHNARVTASGTVTVRVDNPPNAAAPVTLASALWPATVIKA